MKVALVPITSGTQSLEQMIGLAPAAEAGVKSLADNIIAKLACSEYRT